MPLVSYTSDSDSDDAARPPNPKRLKTITKPVAPPLITPPLVTPPLPDVVHNLYAVAPRGPGGKEMHEGRTRTVGHEKGRWPGHVFVEWWVEGETRRLLERLVSDVRLILEECEGDSSSSDSDSETNDPSTLHTLLTSTLGAPLPLHISLSRPLTITTVQKPSFQSAILRTLKQSWTAPFPVRPTHLSTFHSPDSKRTFVVLSLAGRSTPADIPGRKRKASPETSEVAATSYLAKLTTKINAVVTTFGQNPLYASSSLEDTSVDESAFHISIAWTHGPIPKSARARISSLLTANSSYASLLSTDIPVNSVKLKLGSTITDVPLTKTHRQKSMFI